MAWAEPRFTHGEIDEAGRLLVRRDTDAFERAGALDMIGNWRSCHAYPLNSLQMTLRARAGKSALVVQRLKRLPSMLLKIRRLPRLRLSGIQDVAGCRAVLTTVTGAISLRDRYLNSHTVHRLVRQKDYIVEPKPSGYRSLHLIYEYRGKKVRYRGLQVEIQIRSVIQHAWATTVEIMGSVLQESYKTSEGSDRWLHFFKLTGSAFAALEKCALVPDTPPDPRELRNQITALADELQVEAKLRAYSNALNIILEHEDAKNYYYFLLELNPSQEALTINAFKFWERREANAAYLEAEKRQVNTPGAQTVLVAGSPLRSLKRAYPNYYLDASVFLNLLQQVKR